MYDALCPSRVAWDEKISVFHYNPIKCGPVLITVFLGYFGLRQSMILAPDRKDGALKIISIQHWMKIVDDDDDNEGNL